MMSLIWKLLNSVLLLEKFSMTLSKATILYVVALTLSSSYHHKSHHQAFDVQASDPSPSQYRLLLRRHHCFCASVLKDQFHECSVSERLCLEIWEGVCLKCQSNGRQSGRKHLPWNPNRRKWHSRWLSLLRNHRGSFIVVINITHYVAVVVVVQAMRWWEVNICFTLLKWRLNVLKCGVNVSVLL